MRLSSELKKAVACLEQANHSPLTVEERQKKTIELATRILLATHSIRNEFEERKQRKRATYIHNSKSRRLLLALTDQCFRSKNLTRISDQISYVLKRIGIPESWSTMDKFKLFLFKQFGSQFPSTLVPITLRAIQKEFSDVVYGFSDPKQLNPFLKKLHKKGFETNINLLGEAILGEEQAERHLQQYINLLKIGRAHV